MSNKNFKSSSEADDTSSVYTDDFESDSRLSTPDNKQHVTRGNTKSISVKKQAAKPSPASNGKSYQKKGATSRKIHMQQSPGIKPSYHSSASRGARSNPNTAAKPGMIQTHMLSAQRSRINELNNELGDLQSKLEEATKENRLLKKLQYRQEKSLQRLENKDGDIPRLISHYEDDQKVLKARLRKSQESERLLESKLRESTEEMQKADATLQRLKKLVEDKNLGERSELTKQLNTAQERLYESEKKAAELDKKLDLTTQSLTRQVNSEKLKHVDTKERLKTVEQRCDYLENRLKEKERALQVSNIYAMRAKSSPEKTSTCSNRLSGRKSSKKGGRASDANPGEREAHSVPASPGNSDGAEKHFSDQSHSLRERESASEGVDGGLASSRPSKLGRVEKDEASELSSGEKMRELANGLDDLNFRKSAASQPTDGGKDPLSFLKSNKSSNSTFISNSGSSSNPSSRGSDKEQSTFLREKSFTIESRPTKRVSQEEEEKIAAEEKKKAALLAKMRSMDEDGNKAASDGNQLRKILDGDLPANHKPAPSRLVKTKKPSFDSGDAHPNTPPNKARMNGHHQQVEEKELMFGGYAPTVTSAPKRKLQSHPAAVPHPSTNDADEPLLDLNGGKMKNSNLLDRLFGNDTSTPPNEGNRNQKPPSSSSRRISISKTTTRTLSQNGYPWDDTQTNGSTSGQLAQRQGSFMGSPLIKASRQAAADDEIEEMVL